MPGFEPFEPAERRAAERTDRSRRRSATLAHGAHGAHGASIVESWDMLDFAILTPPVASKHPHPDGRRVNLMSATDYQQLRQEVSWDLARKELGYRDHAPINLAHICVDRHAERARAAKVALIPRTTTARSGSSPTAS
jgi:hypothetical protein